MKRALSNNRGEGAIDIVVLVLCALFVIALALRVLPAYILKLQLDTFATELVREAEISGRIGAETTARERLLREKIGIEPIVKWSKNGKIQLNEEITLTVTYPVDIGMFGGLKSFLITLRADAAGKGEIYWK